MMILDFVIWKSKLGELPAGPLFFKYFWAIGKRVIRMGDLPIGKDYLK